MIGNVRYAIKEISKNWDDRGWWRQRFIARVIGPTLKHIHRADPINYMSHDWDNLIILDACRADMFEETFNITDFAEYEKVVSPGASSPEWMKSTFQGKSFPDTIYVSGNPWISKIAPDSFHEIVNVWTQEYDVDIKELEVGVTLDDVNTEGRGTSRAKHVTDAAIEAHKRYPHKRIIVHYFQPHAPTCGNSDGSLKKEIDHSLHPGGIRDGEATKDETWEAYKENLQYAFHHARNVEEEIGGKTVYTADHGELFGDILTPYPVRGYAHPTGVHHPQLLTVPWAVSKDERRDIIEGETVNRSVPETDVNKRLRDLGYTT